MRVLCISDIHLDAPSDPQDEQRQLFIDTAHWFAGLIKNHTPDVVVNLGDTNHRDGGMSVATIGLFREFFDIITDAVRDEGISLYTVVGNHDQHTRNGEIHVLEPLKWVSTVVDKARVETWENIRVLLAPYRRELEQYYAEIEEASKGEYDIVFTHMDVIGAKMNSGVQSSHGIPSDWWGLAHHKGLPMPVYNGHYHQPQKVGKVTVVGAPQYTQFRDIDPAGTPKRGALMLDVTKDAKGVRVEETRFANPHTKVFGKFKGDTVESLNMQFGGWSKSHGHPAQPLCNLWFVAPSPVLAEYQKSFDSTPFGVVRFTPNEKVKVEETTITIDFDPNTAVKQYLKDAPCSCKEEHSDALGIEAIEHAQSYSTGYAKGRDVKFAALSIENFMSIGSAAIILDKPGMTLIEGVNADDSTVDSNGSGKSSIAEALLWALFDRTSRGIKADEVIRRGTKKATVHVAFEIDGAVYGVTRERAKSKPVCRITTVTRDGVAADITPHDQREANAFIERLLGVSYEQFLLMVVMAQGFEQKFSSFSDTDRKQLLESFLGIEVYEYARAYVQGKCKELQAKVDVLARQELQAETIIETSQKTRSTALYARQKAEAEGEAARDALEAQIEAASAAATAAAAYVEVLKNEHAAITECARNIEGGYTALSQRIANGERFISLRREQRQSALLQLEKLAEGGTCAECGQALPEASVATTRAAYERTAADADTLIEKAAVQLDSLKTQLAELNTERGKEWGEVEEAAQRLLDAQTDHAGKVATLNALRAQHKALMPQLDYFDQIIAGADRQIEEANALLVNTKENKFTVDKDLHSCEYWMSAFEPTGIRSVILRTVVNYLNEYLHEMCGIVTGGSYLVQLSSTKELKSKKESVNKLDIVVAPEGSYKAGSGGERRKIDLLLNLAVARLAKQTSGFSSNILIADEVLDNLDLTASQHVLQMFDDAAKKGTSVFLISHNPSVKPLIPNVITVVKRKGVSEVLNG